MHFPEALRDPLPFSALNMPVPEAGSASMLFAQEAEESRARGGESFLSTLYADESFPLEMPSLEPRQFSPEDMYSPYDFPIAFDSNTLDLWDLNSPLLETTCM
jgi:hypothetical protein